MADLKKSLFNTKVKTENKTEILLEQYKLYINLMDKIAERRLQINSFFLTVNSTAITLMSLILKESETQNFI